MNNMAKMHFGELPIDNASTLVMVDLVNILVL